MSCQRHAGVVTLVATPPCCEAFCTCHPAGQFSLCSLRKQARVNVCCSCSQAKAKAQGAGTRAQASVRGQGAQVGGGAGAAEERNDCEARGGAGTGGGGAESTQAADQSRSSQNVPQRLGEPTYSCMTVVWKHLAGDPSAVALHSNAACQSQMLMHAGSRKAEAGTKAEGRQGSQGCVLLLLYLQSSMHWQQQAAAGPTHDTCHSCMICALSAEA